MTDTDKRPAVGECIDALEHALYEGPYSENTAGCRDVFGQWLRHTVCYDEVGTVREIIDPLVQLAKDYLEEPVNGVRHLISIGAIKPDDYLAILEQTVKDFVAYVAHRHQTSLLPNTWRQ